MIRKACKTQTCNVQRLLLCCLLFGALLPVSRVSAQDAGAPIANDDFFNVREDSALTVSAPGLFANDDQLTDSLMLVLVSPPANGTVVVNADGSFAYTPDAGFFGVDDFSYMIETIPMQVLDVDTSQSSLNFDMAVTIILGKDQDQIDAKIGGSASLFLDPETAPFTQAHLYDLNLVVIDSLDLEFRFGGLITIGRLIVDADSGAFKLNLSQRGDPAPVSDGFFTQMGNKVNVVGMVNLTGTGLIAGEVPEEPQEFDTETDADLSIQLAQDGTLLTAEVPVLLEEAFDLSGTAVELKVEGTLLASGELKLPQQSNVATVTVTIDPISRTDVDRELPFQYALSQNYPNPFNPVTTIAFSVPTAEFVTLRVYDMLGREVTTLVDGIQAPGIHEIQFDAGHLPSGMYIYRMESNGYNEMKKLVLLK